MPSLRNHYINAFASFLCIPKSSQRWKRMWRRQSIQALCGSEVNGLTSRIFTADTHVYRHRQTCNMLAYIGGPNKSYSIH